MVHHEDFDPSQSARGSLWVFAGDGRQFIRSNPLDGAEGWVKVVGPTDLEIVDQARRALEQFFSKNGIVVFSEAFSD
jgi:hypothetical protein